MTEHLVFRQLQQLPDSLKQEVLDFIGYLLQKHHFQQQNLPKNKSGAMLPRKKVAFTVLKTNGKPFKFNREEANER